MGRRRRWVSFWVDSLTMAKEIGIGGPDCLMALGVVCFGV